MKIRQIKILGYALLLGGLALTGVGLWRLLSPAQYAATTRIHMLSDYTDYIEEDSFYREHPQKTRMATFDPYFVTFENLQSQIVLSNAIEKLNLNPTSPNRFESVNNIRKHLRLAPIGNTKFIAITFLSNDPNKSAQVANAIVEAYFDYRTTARKEKITRDLGILEHQFQEDEKQISIQQTNIEQRLEQHKLLGAKIEAEKLELQFPKTALVQIMDRAEPPEFPVAANRPLGGVLFGVGLISMLAGWLLLKTKAGQIAA